MFSMLPSIYPRDLVDFIIRNYFRFLDDIFHKWMKRFNIESFYKVFETLDPNLKFIFTELSTTANFLDIRFSIENGDLIVDLHRKLTDSFSFLNYHSCHPNHTRENIGLSLAKRIVQIVSNDRGLRLDELKRYLIMKDHPVSSINFSFSKVFQPQIKEDVKVIVFTSTFNPCHSYNTRYITHALDNLRSTQMKEAFNNYKIVKGTRQSKCLRNLLIKSKYTSGPKEMTANINELFNCGLYHTNGYINECKRFSFGKHNQFKWIYNRHFTCDSKNVIYVLICYFCTDYYIGETDDIKQRTCKHKSDVLHPENSNCKKLIYHLRRCSKMVEPYFKIYPIYYVNETLRRRFIEKRLIFKYKPPRNSDN